MKRRDAYILVLGEFIDGLAKLDIDLPNGATLIIQSNGFSRIVNDLGETLHKLPFPEDVVEILIDYPNMTIPR